MKRLLSYAWVSLVLTLFLWFLYLTGIWVFVVFVCLPLALILGGIVLTCAALEEICRPKNNP